MSLWYFGSYRVKDALLLFLKSPNWFRNTDNIKKMAKCFHIWYYFSSRSLAVEVINSPDLK